MNTREVYECAYRLFRTDRMVESGQERKAQILSKFHYQAFSGARRSIRLRTLGHRFLGIPVWAGGERMPYLAGLSFLQAAEQRIAEEIADTKTFSLSEEQIDKLIEAAFDYPNEHNADAYANDEILRQAYEEAEHFGLGTGRPPSSLHVLMNAVVSGYKVPTDYMEIYND